MTNSLTSSRLRDNLAPGLLLLALIDAVFEYFSPGNGIHGSEGALLVVVSTLLMLVATALISAGIAKGWFRTVLNVLAALDFIGTLFAAYLLQAWLLLALVILAAIAWIAGLVRPSTRYATAG